MATAPPAAGSINYGNYGIGGIRPASSLMGKTSSDYVRNSTVIQQPYEPNDAITSSSSSSSIGFDSSLQNGILPLLRSSLNYIFTSNDYLALFLEASIFLIIWNTIQTLQFSFWLPRLKKKPYWEKLKTRAGFALPNHQKELVYLLSIVPHHRIAGVAMFAGWWKADAGMIRHGILWEAAFNFQVGRMG